MSARRRRARLAFVGDICFGAGWRPPGTSSSGTALERIRPLYEDADLMVGNLECCLVDERCSATARAAQMAVPGEFVAELSHGRVDAVTLANNHIMDCGDEGLESTMRVLDAAGIAHFGAGTDLAAAMSPRVLTAGDFEVALLGFADFSYCFAEGARPGVAPLRRKYLRAAVERAKASAEVVVVCLHADLEFSPSPASWRRRLSHWLVEQGADLVIQHHPHVLQGIESVRGRVVAYSLGNSVFRVADNPYQRDRCGTADSMVLTVDLLSDGGTIEFSWSVSPAEIDTDHRPRPAHDERAARAAIDRLSRGAGDAAWVRREWARRCREELRANLYDFYYCAVKRGVGTALADCVALARSPEARRWMRGLVSFGHW